LIGAWFFAIFKNSKLGDMGMRQLLRVLVAVAIFSMTPLCAKASYIASVMTNLAPNTFEDGSRETVFDTNADGRFDTGDVIAGIVEIRLVNSNDISHPDHIYGIFSQQVASIVPNGSNFDVFFQPTTATGLTLSALTGAAQPATGIIAVYTDASGFGATGQVGSPTISSLLSNPPAGAAGTVSIKDYASVITSNGTREMVIGVNPNQEAIAGNVDTSVSLTGPSVAQKDYFHAITTTVGSGLALPGGYSLMALLTTGQTVATIDFGLTILVSPPDVIFGNTGTGSTGLATGFQYQATLSSGAARGGSNDPTYPVYSTNGNDFTSTQNAVGGFQDNGTFQVTPTTIAPEPGSLVLFGGLACTWMVGFAARRRRQTA